MVVARATFHALQLLTSDLCRGCGYGPCAGELECKLRSKAQRAQLQLPTDFDSSSNHTRPIKRPAQILYRIHIPCHRLLKTAPLLWLLRCPHLYFHLSCRNQASYTATPPPAPSRLASPTKAHGSPRTPPFLHPLLSPLGEASPPQSVTVLRSSSRLNLSMLRRGSDR